MAPRGSPRPLKLFDTDVPIEDLRDDPYAADLLTLDVKHFPMFDDLEPAF